MTSERADKPPHVPTGKDIDLGGTTQPRSTPARDCSTTMSSHQGRTSRSASALTVLRAAHRRAGPRQKSKIQADRWSRAIAERDGW